MSLRIRISLFLLLLSLVGACLTGCSNPENEVPILHNDNDYYRVMSQVRNLTLEPFQKPDDAAISLKEQHDLRLAALKIQGIIGYRPDIFSNYLIAGKIAFLLQDYGTAQRNFYACVALPWVPGDDQGFYLQTTSEAHYMLSKCYFLDHQYQDASYQAEIAVKHEPNDPLYRLAEAEAEFQMGHNTTAKGMIADLLKLQPGNERALMLKKMIDTAPTSKTNP